ncbi:MAG: radical SAM domain-containing protein [Candidatus Magasanikbacteria bacterium CG10_big_fil_rev_8_21_14_0_10_36_32]|uniref:Radical SAM domain-containing protein n=1 Tax=Candidatus Magasanikbacteria bacterium CG10_big_fil_rev_8_21_14_0_10_36_32 TaxID=1974646 RepID=A0A2M6W5T4_9BACT|nr:MAG: radical SAM domain-containing protein [Candidatus Magasanikbacteria bacterium CG10_big_fil_rev_8_21_14_0_10_36_32]
MLKSLREKDRKNLSELIPLEMPFTLLVEPTNLCTLACKFCPTSDVDLLKKFNRQQGMMDYELFKKIIDDIKTFNSKLKKLYLYKDGEPLLNPKLIDMIQYAKDMDVAEDIRLTTNGTLLTPEMNRKLVQAGLNLIQISINAVSDEGYNKICNRKVSYKKLVENITDLYNNRGCCQMHIKFLDCNRSVEEREKFVKDFQKISTSINIETLHGWSASDAKDFTLNIEPDTTPDGVAFIPKEVCPFPFFSLAINFNGTVSICCVDWSHGTVVGDLRKQSLREIWEGKALYDFRVMHLKKQRHYNRACKDCCYITTASDCIDDDAVVILERLAKKYGK